MFPVLLRTFSPPRHRSLASLPVSPANARYWADMETPQTQLLKSRIEMLRESLRTTSASYAKTLAERQRQQAQYLEQLDDLEQQRRGRAGDHSKELRIKIENRKAQLYWIEDVMHDEYETAMQTSQDIMGHLELAQRNLVVKKREFLVDSLLVACT